MNDKRYYADVELTYSARRVFDTKKERDEYLVTVTKEAFGETNPLYDSVESKITKDGFGYGPINRYSYRTGGDNDD